MADDDVQYEFNDVRAIRGTEARTIAKWQKDGWELHTQNPGTLQTKLTFRRPTPKTPWRLLAGLGGVLLVLAIVIVIGVQVEGRTPEPAQPTPQAEAIPSEQPSGQPTEKQEAEPSQSAAQEILTVANNEELAAVLAEGDYCSDVVEGFAARHEGRTIEFDGNIAYMNNHGTYKTRYDMLVSAGDYSETTAIGPAFQFRDVGISDLNLTGSRIPDYVGMGDNLHIVAQIEGYDSNRGCLFFLDPVSTTVR